LIVDLLIEGIDGVRCGFASGHPGALGVLLQPGSVGRPDGGARGPERIEETGSRAIG
jgi:hypothetical protein